MLGFCVYISLTLLVVQNSRPYSRPYRPIDVIPPLLEKPLAPSTESSHPIHQLITKAEKDFAAIKTRQSGSLAKAVEEYKRRYRLPPPPNFDIWYEFAIKQGTELIDEFDTIYHLLRPFWGLKPSLIRARAREALGFPNGLLGLAIRNGAIVKVAGGSDWRQKSTVGMIKDFAEYLPAMDLAFNVYDEPRVIVPSDDLSRLVSYATNVAMPAAFQNSMPQNDWSSQDDDIEDGAWPSSVNVTSFTSVNHQPTWASSRVSCSPDSPARTLNESAQDAEHLFAFSQLGFLSNKTAFTDICLSPSLKERYGFFDRTDTFNVVNDLFPVFSHSKISSYQDILYPSPWYWSNKVVYDQRDDYRWEKKKNKLYWRGSTTGGFSQDGGWRRHHRQLFVAKLNDVDSFKVMKNVSVEADKAHWIVAEDPKTKYQELIDVKFTRINQCTPADCDAQHDVFEVVKLENQITAWRYKYLLDIDGNSFSGRFYAFLRSMSLVFKMAVFREWHEELLIPWVHYVPLGLKGDEYIESVRYFNHEPDGQTQAFKLAKQGRDWARKVLRSENLEIWLFRLLLE